jgi:hypothetical protein
MVGSIPAQLEGVHGKNSLLQVYDSMHGPPVFFLQGFVLYSKHSELCSAVHFSHS